MKNKITETLKVSLLFPFLTGVCFMLFLSIKTLDKIVQYAERSV